MSHPVHALARRLVALAARQPPGVDLLIGADHQGVVDIQLTNGPPEAVLMGWRAPASWHAILLLASGRPTAPTGPTGPARPLAVIVEAGDAPRLLIHNDLLECGPCPLTDALQRAIGATTAPPALAGSTLAARVWLHRLVDLAADHPRPTTLSWTALARRHPAIASLVSQAIPADARGLVRAESAPLDQLDGWRRLARSLRHAPLHVTPGLEHWFDAGSLERWLLHLLPEPSEVLDDLDSLLDPSCATSVRRVCSDA